MSEFELVWDARCSVAESPVWDAAERRLLFCDINGKRINALSVDTGARETWDFPEVVGSFGLCRSGRLVVAQRHHVVLFDPKIRRADRPDGESRGTADQPPERRQGRPGRRVLGRQYGRELAAPEGRRTLSRHRGWPDHQAGGRLSRYQMVWPGRPMAASCIIPIQRRGSSRPGTSTRRPAVAPVIGCWQRLTNEDGRPDGAATDADGNYWSAGPSAGCINCFSPAGELLRKWAFPVPGPTMPCFAGEWLYVTSLREGKSAEVLAEYPTLGGLFRAAAPAAGAAVGLFAD